jgi:hypothetical protein
MMIHWENVAALAIVAAAAGYLLARFRRRRRAPTPPDCDGDCLNCVKLARPDDCADPATRQKKIDN